MNRNVFSGSAMWRHFAKVRIMRSSKGPGVPRSGRESRSTRSARLPTGGRDDIFRADLRSARTRTLGSFFVGVVREEAAEASRDPCQLQLLEQGARRALGQNREKVSGSSTRRRRKSSRRPSSRFACRLSVGTEGSRRRAGVNSIPSTRWRWRHRGAVAGCRRKPGQDHVHSRFEGEISSLKQRWCCHAGHTRSSQ